MADTGIPRHVFTSVTRISDLAVRSFEVVPVDRPLWQNGQYVVGELMDDVDRPYDVELGDGRVADALPGDLLVGALGRRAATLQAVGDWESVTDPGRMHMLSMAGVMGRCTSASAFAQTIAPIAYVGHASRKNHLLAMRDFARRHGAGALSIPAVLIVGTSMDAGKTLAATRIIRMLRRRGLRVAAAKVTGVGRYRDILAMRDAGADPVLDFVDAGLPSTVVPARQFEQAMSGLLARIDELHVDAAVVEAGASPMEPYNGDVAVRLLGNSVKAVVLCASDPYAALGVMQAFELEPTFVAGRATCTTAGQALTARLTGHPTIDLLDPAGAKEAEAILAERLGLR